MSHGRTKWATPKRTVSQVKQVFVELSAAAIASLVGAPKGADVRVDIDGEEAVSIYDIRVTVFWKSTES